jgi:inhibitor of KinA
MLRGLAFMKATPYGPNAFLLQFAEENGEAALARSLSLTRALENEPPPGLVEITPAFTTLLLEFEPGKLDGSPAFIPDLVARLESVMVEELPPRPVLEVPVRYDGEDFDQVAQARQVLSRELIELHSAPIYRVSQIGFSPGFPYLWGLDPRLHTPRLPSPRARVRAGSVAIGGEHAGIYSVETPGGWNIVGHTEIKVFDLNRSSGRAADEGIFLLRPGDRLKFIPRR